MIVAWIVYLLWLWILFKELVHEVEGQVGQASNKELTEEHIIEDGLAQPLIINLDDDWDRFVDDRNSNIEQSF